MLLTYPGTPSIFAGDEIGLEGAWGEDSRRTINWEDESGWDHEFFAEVKKLVQIRRQRDSLINGGLRWLAIETDYIAYLRESKKESLLIFISRKGVRVKIDVSPYGYVCKKSLYGHSAEGETVTDMQEESSQSSKLMLEQSNIFALPSKRAEESTARPTITSKTLRILR